ncbi:hypothetical protein DNTS_024214 [Danionella cerebrum]|uniref:Phosphatidylinositol transfer protein beta isoform n=1 Tax=Danionella cerebrum TaxID=2873325 RepID=A0A553N2Y8_9TELE|nr:hypothetical protein DNTS_024214 [Danionella translucida]
MKDDFMIKIETWHKPDMDSLENVHDLDPTTWKTVEVVHIDIADRSQVEPGDYKPDEDPEIFQSEKTGRGPLGPDWKKELLAKTDTPRMCAYKLQEKRIFTNFHRQLFCWIDSWVELTMEDIRRMEAETQRELEEFEAPVLLMNNEAKLQEIIRDVERQPTVLLQTSDRVLYPHACLRGGLPEIMVLTFGCLIFKFPPHYVFCAPQSCVRECSDSTDLVSIDFMAGFEMFPSCGSPQDSSLKYQSKSLLLNFVKRLKIYEGLAIEVHQHRSNHMTCRAAFILQLVVTSVSE